MRNLIKQAGKPRLLLSDQPSVRGLHGGVGWGGEQIRLYLHAPNSAHLEEYHCPVTL